MNILSAIGNTPLVELTNLNKNPKVRISLKLVTQGTYMGIGTGISMAIGVALILP